MKFRFVLPVILILSLSPLITSIAQDQPARFESPTFGYSVVIPDDWRLYSKSENDTMTIVSYGLPPIWSEVEQENIENAIAVIAQKLPIIKSAQDVIDLENKRIASILVSSADVDLEFGSARRMKTRINGLEYETLGTYRYENGVGYAFSFTTTKGTYDINKEKFLDFLATIEFFPPDTEAVKAEASGYQEAVALYRGGPENYPEVISILEKALQDNPADLQAARLLTLVYYDSDRFEDALAMSDSAIKLDDGLNPYMYLYKGRSLAKLGRYVELDFYLGGMWAIFQGDAKLSAAYDELMAELLDSLPELRDTGTVDTSGQ